MTFVAPDELALHAAGWQAGVAFVEATDLQEALQAFISLFVILQFPVFPSRPSNKKEAKATSTFESVEAEAADPLAAVQLNMQPPGGHGLQFAGVQFAGLQLACDVASETAKPPRKKRIINTFFISYRILKI
ncbi:MAG TPA: hypothetical protein VMZ69_11045 [Saprospiraceae bacterium]|nr:hypothetical protein [Saprospiraceae bacterium]